MVSIVSRTAMCSLGCHIAKVVKKLGLNQRVFTLDRVHPLMRSTNDISGLAVDEARWGAAESP